MTVSKVEVTTTPIPIPAQPMPQDPVQQFDWLATTVLHWRHDQLRVKSAPTQPANPLPAMGDAEWLKKCLHHSPVWAVCLEPALGEPTLNHWSTICEQVKKAVFLRSTAALELPQRRDPLSWTLKRGLDWLVAACLLVLLSPVLLLLAGCTYCGSGQPIFAREWRVGHRGELFRIIKFRTVTKDGSGLTSLGRWMQATHLEQLPQLLNVLKGEMTLVGPRPWTLSDPKRATSETCKRLNALPGVIGTWQAQVHSYCFDPDAANQSDLQYLNTWSLLQDLKVLLTVIIGSHRLQQ
jgi:lipopolysaccharide/colanic/teichoic acid biosynthesis glycosyltransferase